MKRGSLGIIGVWSNLLICGAQPELTKLFFHEGALRDRVVLQFSDKVTLQEMAANKNGQKQSRDVESIRFFIPGAKLVSAEARGMLTNINRIKKAGYALQVVPVTKPDQGFEITVTYKPDAMVFSYGTFDSITTQKCVTFNFDDKQKLDLLEKKSKPLHTLASAHKPKIMLDYGHGGADTGKVAQTGVQEKDVVAQVGAQVKLLLQEKGYDVMLTRPQDKFVQLDQRTRCANKEAVDLFVSVHANASRKQDVVGLETYWAGQQLVTTYRAGDARWLAQAHKRDLASKQFAMTVHDTILQEVRRSDQLCDRKVRASCAQVLFATDMPSILIELGFLSNQHEASKLAERSYQYLLAKGISKGVDTFYTKYVQML